MLILGVQVVVIIGTGTVLEQARKSKGGAQRGRQQLAPIWIEFLCCYFKQDTAVIRDSQRWDCAE